MSDLKRQKANRHNAMQSTGPRSDEGKRRSSVNAMRHGLTSPLESSLWAPLLQPIEALLASEGLDKSQQRELAACILNYERNADQCVPEVVQFVHNNLNRGVECVFQIEKG